MEKTATQKQEKPDADTARMSVPQSGGREAREPRMSRYLKLQLFLAHRDVVLLEEARLRLMKQGQDVSRNRLIAEDVLASVREGRSPVVLTERTEHLRRRRGLRRSRLLRGLRRRVRACRRRQGHHRG